MGTARPQLARFLIVVALAAPLFADPGALQIVDYGVSLDGTAIKVIVYNGGDEASARLQASAIVDGLEETALSDTFTIKPGETIEVTIQFAGPIQQITENPDPVPAG